MDRQEWPLGRFSGGLCWKTRYLTFLTQSTSICLSVQIHAKPSIDPDNSAQIVILSAIQYVSHILPPIPIVRRTEEHRKLGK